MLNRPLKYCTMMPKVDLNQTYLFVRLHSDALWPQKSKNFFHRKERHTLWRRLFAASFFQAYQTEVSFQQTRLLCPTQQSLHHLRSDLCTDLSNHPWIRQDRDNPSSETQWSLSVPYRSAEISRSDNPTAISSENGTAVFAETPAASRQTALDDDAQTFSACTYHLRYGLNGPGSLRQTGDGQHRIQSKEAWQAVVPSSRLLQRHHQGLLHGELRPGDAHTATGVLDLMEASFAKVSSSVKVIIRADKGFFDHKTVEYLESKNALFAIVARLTPPIKRTLAGLSYCRYSSGIETAELMRPIKAGHKEHRFVVIRRPIPDDLSEQLSLFTPGEVQLSGHRDKPNADAPQHLEVLQWPGWHRTHYQRTQGRLPFGQDTDKALHSQRSVFSYSAVFVQPDQLVQASLFAKGCPKRDAQHFTIGPATNPRRAGQI